MRTWGAWGLIRGEWCRVLLVARSAPGRRSLAGVGLLLVVDQVLDSRQGHGQLGDIEAIHLAAVLDEDPVADALDRQRVDLDAVVLAVATLPALAVGNDLLARHGDLMALDVDREGLLGNGLVTTGAGMLVQRSSPVATDASRARGESCKAKIDHVGR